MLKELTVRAGKDFKPKDYDVFVYGCLLYAVDPEEYLVFLWEKVLQVEPFLSIS